MISLSERLRPNLRSKYILRPKLSPDFSVQLKVSLSERLSQKLVIQCCSEMCLKEVRNTFSSNNVLFVQRENSRYTVNESHVTDGCLWLLTNNFRSLVSVFTVPVAHVCLLSVTRVCLGSHGTGISVGIRTSDDITKLAASSNVSVTAGLLVKFVVAYS